MQIDSSHCQNFINHILAFPRLRRINARLTLFVSGFTFFLILFYLIFQPFSRKHNISDVDQCVISDFHIKGLRVPDDSLETISFVGNGHISLDASASKQFIITLQNGLNYNLFSGFYPLVNVETSDNSFSRFHFLTDLNEGMSKGIKCTHQVGKCVCLYQFVYAHRTKTDIFVQEIRIRNPSTNTLTFSLFRSKQIYWDEHSIDSVKVYSRSFTGTQRASLAIACSNVQDSITVKPKTEETLRFMCIIENFHPKNATKASNNAEFHLPKTANRFKEISPTSFDQLDELHINAWKALGTSAFNISHSKASNTLNNDRINRVKYALLSTSRVLENFSRQENDQQLMKNSNCYSGHSTLLYPSRLWQDSTDMNEFFKTVEVWKMTLEHHGCNFKSSGANGILQAFLLSLSAATFNSQCGLEIELNPETELHRTIEIKNLRLCDGGSLSLLFDLEPSLTPFVSLNASTTIPIYACTAGCLDPPKILSKKPTKLAIKVTRPPTPILFISPDKSYLEKIKHTLHVTEVLDAPAHESHVVEIHKHGEPKGLPTIFWVTLILLIVLFHLFLLKILVNEWKNPSGTGYTKLNKKVLLRR